MSPICLNSRSSRKKTSHSKIPMNSQKQSLIVKLKRTITNESNRHDVYCFECHCLGDVVHCNSCPRAYHLKCLNLFVPPEPEWICPECDVNRPSFHSTDRSPRVEQRHTVEELNEMLKYALGRLKLNQQVKCYIQTMHSSEVSHCPDVIVHPMDLELIEGKINSKVYRSTFAFIGDLKWIVHNNIIYHGNQSKIANMIRTLLKIAIHEISEIELCSECYLRGAQPLLLDWFTKPCSVPHTLCWAKMKSYQPWPAKVLRVVNDEVDVRFFGQHDRAWVRISNCFVLSKEYPGSDRRKSNSSFEKSLAELLIHIEQLKTTYGYFTYAPPNTLLSKTKPFKFVSAIDDSQLPSYMIVTNTKAQRSATSTASPISNRNIIKNKRHSQSTLDNEQPFKRLRSRSKQNEDENAYSIGNVFDILNETNSVGPSAEQNDHTTQIPFRFRSVSPTDNKLRIQALLKKYVHTKSPKIDLIEDGVRSSMNTLLDDVEALEPIPDNQTNAFCIENLSSISSLSRTRKPRKSNLQHHILPETTHVNLVSSTSLDDSLSPTLPFVPLRPLSVSPPNMSIFESISSDSRLNSPTRPASIEILPMKSEPIDHDEYEQIESSISSDSLLSTNSIPLMIANAYCIPQLPITNSPNNAHLLIPQQSQTINAEHTRMQQRSNLFITESPLERQSIDTNQSCHVLNSLPLSNQPFTGIPPQTNQIQSRDCQVRNEIRKIMNNFNEQFQQSLSNLTSKIELSLQTTQMKYEKQLEETRRSYRLSLNELHTITNEQIHEIQTSLELQYWQRLSEMRNRYESKLRYE